MQLTTYGYLLLVIFVFISGCAYAQRPKNEFDSTFEALRIRTSNPCFNSHLEKAINRTDREKYPRWYYLTLAFSSKASIKDSAFYKEAAREADALASLLIASEENTEFDKNISARTRELISSTSDSYCVLLIRRAMMDNEDISEWLRRKLLKALGEQTDILDDTEASMYRLPSDHKKLVKFTSVRTGNDLFTLAGLYDEAFNPKTKFMKDNKWLFQRNDDRDYTGSLLVEIGTDYLNIHGSNPSKSYQTFLYGFDVYTPYFRDKKIFPADTSFNKLDRPHASFQYFGWSRKTLSFNTKVRSTFTIKAGRVGGQAGAKFQNTLHRDISYSPQPRGWAAQVGNGGRIGVSFEYTAERQDRIKDKNLYTNLIFDGKLGTYMTVAGVGVGITNKSFAQCNPNFISLNRRKKTDRFWQVVRQHLMYRASISYYRVVHNTMLEGYGVFKTTENTDSVVNFAPKSRYILDASRIHRNTYQLNYTVSYSTKYVTFFYNWKCYSPETTNGDIGIPSPYSVMIGKPKDMDISKRWHHFAEIGVSFNIL